VGDVMVKDGDIFGDGVNIAARIEGLAEPGGICISRGVHDHVMRRLSYRFEDLGEKSVKNIAQPIRVFRLIFDGAELETLEAPQAEETSVSSAALAADVTSLSEPLTDSAPSESPQIELMFWDSIKDSARPADFEAYLTQYPEGSFVALARTRLDEFASSEGPARTPQDREVELLFWESVRNSDNPSSLQAYIEKYPDGDFKTLAEIRLAELGAQPRA
jgi:adenylate cyclase